MIRRILALVLGVIGAVAIVLAIMSATTWRDDDTLTATLPQTPETPVLLTDPGVLEMAGDQVTITLEAEDDAEIWAMIAPTERVMEWLGDASRTAVTGLAGSTELASATAGSEESVPPPSSSDLFSGGETGTGELEIEWTDEPGRWTLFAVTDGTEPAPTLSLTWPNSVSTPYLVPGLIAGGVLVLLAVLLFVWPTRRDEEDAIDDEETAPIDVPQAPAGTIDDEAAAESVVAGDYASAPTAGRSGVDPYAPTVSTIHDPVGAGAGSDDDAHDDEQAGVAAPAALTDTETLPAFTDDDADDLSDEDVDAALDRDMAALAAKDRAGEPLRRYERRVLAEARQEAREDLRAGVDTELRQILRDAGPTRGAGLLPYSPRADELRAESAEQASIETPTETPAETPAESGEAAVAAPDAWAVTEIEGRPLTRRERRAAERRALMEKEARNGTSDGSTGAPSGSAAGPDDEWRDLWGFGSGRQNDTEVGR
ncbi:hypothetical protein CZ771_12375 [Actinomycetales bacterium JB111]|nr:hypothetical protein CZ771_12375 [Actinomycetales bacterium JB111]